MPCSETNDGADAATFVALIPIDTLPVLFNAVAIYFVANLRNGIDHFFIYAGLLCLEYFVGISLGMLISALIKNVEMAPRVAPAFVILFLMFSGFLLNDESVPIYMAWLKHISFIRYTFQGLAVNEFAGAEFPEGCEVANNGTPAYSGPLRCATGDDVLEQLSFDEVELSFVLAPSCVPVCQPLCFSASLSLCLSVDLSHENFSQSDWDSHCLDNDAIDK